MTALVPRVDRRHVLLATAVFVLGLVLATFVHPLFRIPDERFHADMMEVASDVDDLVREGWPLVGERRLQSPIAQAARLHSPRRPRTLANAVPRDERVSLSTLGEQGGLGPDNRMTQHAPLYYLLTAGGAGMADALDPGAFAYDMELWFLRLVNLLMLAPLPLLGYLTARRLSSARAVHRAAAVLPLALPGLTVRNGPMLNNDNLVTLLGGVVVYSVVRVVDDGSSRRVALVAGTACGLAMLTKDFGIILLGALGLAYAWSVVRRLRAGGSVVPVVAAGSMAAGASFVFGGWWYVRNLVVAGSIRQIGFPREDLEGFVPDWGHWLVQVLQRSWQSFWGGSYVLDRADATLLLVLLAITVICIVGAFAGGTAGRRHRMVAALVPVLLLALAIYVNQSRNYVGRGRIGGVQGRYFYGGLVGVTSVMAVGIHVLAFRLRRWVPLLVTVGSGALYTIGFHAFLVTEWGAPSVNLASRVRAMLTWAAPAPWFVVVVGLAFAFGGLWLAWESRPGALAGAEQAGTASSSVGVAPAGVESDQQVREQARDDDL